ncbi:hypothetical protein TWF102_005306 [Orbilia oligospora]|uniref:Uncharacterized protein n=1 Tax=Orbilia oligospora TaxID=2813651 RepID=A0A7C8JAL5_ORBOL|nr:hypothetical protein TWF102_005306 [Orbilia oligospora]KAF3101900.1 hypothetical protein TWF103_007882 [Orbilia oligospora]
MQNSHPQTLTVSNGLDPLLQEGRGAGGGGGGGGGSGAGRIRHRSRTCAYITETITNSANPLYTQSYGVKCPHNAACAYSASYVGCVGTSTSSGTTSVTPTTRPVPTTCIAFEDLAASLLTRTDISPQTLLCTGPYVLCQTFTLVQSENTFTGFTCRASTVPSATVTGGSWGTYPPTSIPTPIDQLYHIAKAPYTGTASSTSAGPAATSPSSAYQVHPGMDILSIPTLLFFFLLFKAL